MAGTVTPVADVTVGASATELMPADAKRDRAVVQNTGAANMRIGVGFDPTASKGLQLGPGHTLALDVYDGCRNQIKVIRESGTSTSAGGYGVD